VPGQIVPNSLLERNATRQSVRIFSSQSNNTVFGVQRQFVPGDLQLNAPGKTFAFQRRNDGASCVTNNNVAQVVTPTERLNRNRRLRE
jgi:hypothetical protein